MDTDRRLEFFGKLFTAVGLLDLSLLIIGSALNAQSFLFEILKSASPQSAGSLSGALIFAWAFSFFLLFLGLFLIYRIPKQSDYKSLDDSIEVLEQK